MDLNKEGDEAARKLIESFRSFIVDTIREENYGSSRTCRPRLGNHAASAGAEVNNDLLQAMKELFVVNPALVRSNVIASEGCTERVEPSSQSPNSLIHFGDKNRRNERLSSKVEDNKFNSKKEEKDVNKLGVIEKCIIFHDSADDVGDLLDSYIFENSEPDFARRSTAAETKSLENSPRNGAGLMPKSICKEEEQALVADQFKLSGRFSESGLGDSLLDSADSGVFMNMAGLLLHARSEAEIGPGSDRKVNTSTIYSKSEGYKEELYQGPKGNSSKPLTVNSSVCQGEPGLRSSSKIPVLSKNRRISLGDKKQKEKTWMQSLRESIMKFKDYDFGAAGIPDKRKNENGKPTKLKSAQSMGNLSYSSPRFQESNSFWEQRTSLEKDYSKYLEDERQVLKDVKCDIEYEEANDFAKRRLNEAKRRKSRSLFDISAIQEPNAYGYFSAETGQHNSNLKRGRSVCSSSYLGSRHDANNNTTFENRLFLRQSKIPVFIGNV